MSRYPAAPQRGGSSALVAVLLGLFAVSVTSAAQPDASTAEPPQAAADDEPRSRSPERRRAERTADTETEAAAEPAAETPAEPGTERRAAPTALVDADDIVVCRNQRIIGTKIKRRVCAPAAAWAEAERRTSNAAEEGFRQVRERSGIALGAPSAPPTTGGGN